MMMKKLFPFLAALLSLNAAQAQEKVLNLYSARHYQADEALYNDFTKQTGIRINRIEGKAHELLERIRNEGANSPADVFITVDAASLAVANAWGIFAPVKSAVLEARIPAYLRSETWFAFSTRARMIIYNKRKLKAEDVPTYESLADPKLKGLYCSIPGGHIYNLTWVASQIVHQGEARAEEWARGLVANLARNPRGGDTDQIKSVATGECGVAVSNSYYLVRMMASERVEDRNLVKRLGVVWPNQGSYGTHINVSGAGLVKTSKNREAAIRFLEYLASDDAQRYFANGNNEWPAVPTVKVSNEELAELGQFKADTTSLVTIANQLPAAQKLLDRTGYR
ncbi:Fe(3+) ABC transporter substrate-binding protein [Azonexus hydrophilus]|uniref:Fe(3+) ABC transporter substrate-binding protein n=1 Tax=Azonexus hydrophilus TaxID=418702 RepID=A0A1R1I5B6_9RHOO|nr:Fe(3+) ABC transporter substrate-binding protein [Azonexus hydrophilus]